MVFLPKKVEGDLIMTQGLFSINIEEEKREKNLTCLTGFLLYLELFEAIGLTALIDRHLKIKENRQGWRDAQIILFLLLLNLAGGESVSDIELLESDEGFCRILKHLELRGTVGRRREKIQRRWRKRRENVVAKPSSIFRYLAYFHDESEEKRRVTGKSFIPRPNEYLKKFRYINYELVNFVQRQRPVSTATLDFDATLSESNKRNALFCYDGYKAYQGLNAWWFEQDLVVHSEFRDGNVNAAHDLERFFIETLDLLPPGVETVYVRSDTAAYRHKFLKLCDSGDHPRFGRIKFAVGADVSDSFKKAILSDKDLEWNSIHKVVKGEVVESGHEWAEVCFVPNKIAQSKTGLEYRYIAVREELEQETLPGLEDCMELPFPTLEMSNKHYKVTALVTNLDWYGEPIVHWYRGRCGKSEEAHGIMKEDFAGGRFPSSKFGVNAAWWWIMILSLNIQSIMKQQVLGGTWKNKRMKAFRFHVINIPGRIALKEKRLTIYISRSHPALKLLLKARKRIREIVYGPGPPY